MGNNPVKLITNHVAGPVKRGRCDLRVNEYTALGVWKC